MFMRVFVSEPGNNGPKFQTSVQNEQQRTKQKKNKVENHSIW